VYSFCQAALFGTLSKTRWFLGGALVDGGLDALGLAVDCCGNAVVSEANDQTIAHQRTNKLI
jgi:hypothetical protein